MDKAILLTKLNNYENTDFELYKYYLDATSKLYTSEKVEFETCMNDIKILTNKQYDFDWLTENSKIFECNRREFKALCDDVCVILGNRINELCKHTREPIITKPSKFEDYCPFETESLVVVYTLTVLFPLYPISIVDDSSIQSSCRKYESPALIYVTPL